MKKSVFFVFLLPLLMAFSPLKTRPVKYEDSFGSSLTIFPNCKDDGFSFTLVQGAESCAEMITGAVGPGRAQRYEKEGLVLIFNRGGRTVRITEEGQYAHGTSCGTFSGTYKRVEFQ